MPLTPGDKFKLAMQEEQPLQLVGCINAYVAIMAQKAGFRALYLSGAGVANSSYGLPDIGITTLDNVLEDTRRITTAVDLPLIVDIDTGWGSAGMIRRAIQALTRAGAAGVHIEDQVTQKRCGHLPGKEVVPIEEMKDRLKAAVDARIDPSFLIVARTDALQMEGLDAAIARGIAYKESGADILFPEAFQTLEQYRAFKEAVGIPILANITEFGKTPLFTLQELKSANVDIALYPLSVNRAMNLAAQKTLQGLREKGTQKGLLDQMQTRQQLYEFLNHKNNELDK